LGVAPSQAAKSRPDLKACGSGALARIAESGERADARDAPRQPADRIASMVGDGRALEFVDRRV
jgi:hypothetical protein